MATLPRIQAGQTGNRLLDKLAPADFRLVTGKLEPVRLPIRHVLFREDEPLQHLYFPVSAVLSLVVLPSPQVRQGVEIATVGKEGMAGFTAILGVPTSFYQAVCQVPGDCLRLPVSVLAEAMARPAVDALVKRYIAVSYRLAVQAALCNTLH